MKSNVKAWHALHKQTRTCHSSHLTWDRFSFVHPVHLSTISKAPTLLQRKVNKWLCSLALSLFFLAFAYQMRPRAKRGGLTRANLDTDDYQVGRVTHGRTRGHPSEAVRQLRVDGLGRAPLGTGHRVVTFAFLLCNVFIVFRLRCFLIPSWGYTNNKGGTV